MKQCVITLLFIASLETKITLVFTVLLSQKVLVYVCKFIANCIIPFGVMACVFPCYCVYLHFFTTCNCGFGLFPLFFLCVSQNLQITYIVCIGFKVLNHWPCILLYELQPLVDIHTKWYLDRERRYTGNFLVACSLISTISFFNFFRSCFFLLWKLESGFSLWCIGMILKSLWCSVWYSPL